MRALELGAVDFVAKPKIGLADGMRQLSDDITDKIRAATRARIKRAPAATPAGAAPVPAVPLQAVGRLSTEKIVFIGASTGGTEATKDVLTLLPPDFPAVMITQHMPPGFTTSYAKRLAAPPAAGAAPPKPATLASLGRLSTEKIIFIGASTGGTEATRELIVQLPPDSPAVMITQHMPPGFTKSYATRLDGLARIRVAEATDGERVLPGHAYIAPGGFHLTVERSGANYIARVRDGDPVNRHKPSVEVLFQSAARVVGPNALGVMLTGMGADGARAMREMRDAGSWNVAQDEASCVVFGMPKEAIKLGAVDDILPLDRVARAILQFDARG